MFTILTMSELTTPDLLKIFDYDVTDNILLRESNYIAHVVNFGNSTISMR